MGVYKYIRISHHVKIVNGKKVIVRSHIRKIFNKEGMKTLTRK